MTAKYFAILTNQGAARLANAAALGTKLNLTQMAVGDANGTLPTPDPAQTKLISQKRIAPLNLLTVDPVNTSQIIAEQIIPENEGGFWIREIGLYDADGILIAVANCPETYKPQLQEGSGRTQTIRMILIVSSTSAITLKIDPSVVLATRQYVDDKVIEVKSYADELMNKHIADKNPHKQYAPLVSPAFEGEATVPTQPKGTDNFVIANTAFVGEAVATAITKILGSAPSTLNTLGKLATAIGNNPAFATSIETALAGKQPLDATLTTLSGKTADGIFQYLGLKDAAKRDVGTGGNQIPDMSAFTSGTGWCRYPDGTIFQYGTVGFAPGVNNQFVNLPRAFTTTSYRVICTWNDVGVSQGGSEAQPAADYGLGASTKTTTRFGLWQGGPGGFNIDFIAIGR